MLPVLAVSLVAISAALAITLVLTVLLRRNVAMRHLLLTTGLAATIVAPVFAIAWQEVDWLRETRTVAVALPEIVPAPEPRTVDVETAFAAPNPFLLASLDRDGTTFDVAWIVRGILAVWLLGSIVFAVRALVSWLRVRRLVRGATPIERESPARVLQSSSLGGPISGGIIRPFVVLPTVLVETLDASELDAVLEHETSHLERRDQVVLLLQHVALVLFWVHPLLFVLNRWLAVTREELSDAAAVGTIDARRYAELLLRVGVAFSAARTPAVATGFFARHWRLEDRIAGILARAGRPIERPPFALRVALVLVVSLAVLPLTALTVDRPAHAAPQDLPIVTSLDDIAPALAELAGRELVLRRTANGIMDRLATIEVQRLPDGAVTIVSAEADIAVVDDGVHRMAWLGVDDDARLGLIEQINDVVIFADVARIARHLPTAPDEWSIHERVDGGRTYTTTLPTKILDRRAEGNSRWRYSVRWVRVRFDVDVHRRLVGWLGSVGSNTVPVGFAKHLRRTQGEEFTADKVTRDPIRQKLNDLADVDVSNIRNHRFRLLDDATEPLSELLIDSARTTGG